MARPRKNNLSIDEEIIKQEELLADVEKSCRTYEEIMAFLKNEG